MCWDCESAHHKKRKLHFTCFKCRTNWKRHYFENCSIDISCPKCENNDYCQRMSYNFRPPKKENDKAWKLVEKIFRDYKDETVEIKFEGFKERSRQLKN